jgi:hypothetical protein
MIRGIFLEFVLEVAVIGLGSKPMQNSSPITLTTYIALGAT